MMTCLLSLPPLLTNPFSEGGVEKQRIECENFAYNWISPNQGPSEMSNGERCTDSSHVGTCFGASISHGKKDIRNNVCKVDMREDHFNKPCETDLVDIETDREISYNNNHDVKLAMCDKGKELLDQSDKRDHGIKRKVDSNESKIDYIPSKRISPFLNTPKQRKDERKKILKISIKKIKQLSDPEGFLRRTVLVNNTMKRLQSELNGEKFKTKRRKSFNIYGVPTNNCLSDSYLCDDPFLSGVNEEITDDMTDTLIKNVFHDKQNDIKKDSVSEKPDIDAKSMDISEDNECATAARLETQLSVVGVQDSNESSNGESNVFVTHLKDTCKFPCVTYRTNCKEMDSSVSNEPFCFDINTT